MSVLEAFLLGLVQGITEFLPISSSGHLLLASQWFEIPASQNLFFILSLHLATCLSILLVFYKDIFFLVKGGFVLSVVSRSMESRHSIIFKNSYRSYPYCFGSGCFLKNKLLCFSGSSFSSSCNAFFNGLFLLILKIQKQQ